MNKLILCLCFYTLVYSSAGMAQHENASDEASVTTEDFSSLEFELHNAAIPNQEKVCCVNTLSIAGCNFKGYGSSCSAACSAGVKHCLSAGYERACYMYHSCQ